MLPRRVLNRTLVYQINREEVPPGNNQKGLLEGKPTVQLNRTLGFPELLLSTNHDTGKSTPWTDTGVDQNFQRDLRAIHKSFSHFDPHFPQIFFD